MVTDLTQGNIYKKLWFFSIPMLFSVMFQQLYNMADSMIAGKFAGVDSLAAIGASYPVTMLFMAVAIGSNIGCSVVISQLFGAKSYKKMYLAVTTGFLASLAISIILSILGLCLSRSILQWLNTPADIMAEADVYLKIYIAGLVFLFLYNICTGIFNALGNSTTPMILLIFSSIGNIVLDFIFVYYFHWGVAGVAWATFLAQGFSCICSILILWKQLKQFREETVSKYFDMDMLKKISRIAIPSILQQSFISVGNIFIQRIINEYGAPVIAGYSAAMKLNTFAITSFTTLANGLSSFTAQNLGAGKIPRIKKGFHAGALLALITALPFFLLFFFLYQPLLELFMDSSQPEVLAETLETGKNFLHIVSPFYFIISLKLMSDAILRGASAMKWFMTTTFTDLILRVILAYCLPSVYGATGIWISWPLGWSTAAVMSIAFFYKGVWKKNNTYNM